MFDSGVGGWWVLAEIRRLLPRADLVYLADRGRAPYGPQPQPVVRRYAEQVVDLLLDRGARMIVVACNAASTAALHHLRALHPEVPFVGMEPAVKPAVAATRTGVIGVLTTAVTSQGELFASVVRRFAPDVTVIPRVCEGWVPMVEAGRVDGPEVEETVRGDVVPLLEAGADTLVLACTHYSFLRDIVVGVAEGVSVIDPAPAVARRAAEVARTSGCDGGAGRLDVITTGDPSDTSRVIERLTGLRVDAEPVTLPSDG